MFGQETLGPRIRDLRVRRGFSQAQLALPELSDSYVSLIESGKRIPTPSVVRLLARKLGCSASYLTSGVSEEMLARLREMLQYAHIALQNGEVEEARAKYAEAVQHPDISAFPELTYEARWGHALALEARGLLDDAVAEFDSLVAGVSPETDPDRWAWLHIALCRCHRERGDFGAGVAAGERGLDRLSGQGKSWTESMVMLGATLLSVFYERGDLVHARQFAERLIERAEEVSSTTARAAVYWNAGIAAEYRGELDEALRLVERALALLGENDDARNLARLREDYGRLLLRARPDQAQRAHDILRKAGQELADSAAGSVDYAQCLADLARAEIVLGRPKEAVRLATDALKRLEGDSRLQTAGALIVLGRGHAGLGLRDEAGEVLAQAAEQLEGMRASRHAAQAWLDLAELLKEAGSEKKSVEAYRHALACAGL